MDNSILENNLAHIKKYDKDLADKILNAQITEEISITQSQNEEYNLLIKNRLIHDINNPTQEAKNIAQNFKNNTENSIVIVYELGLGYLVEEIAKYPCAIIIYEPNLSTLKYILSIAQIDSLFQKRVIICNDKKALFKWVHNIADDKTKASIAFLNSSKSLFFDDIKEVLNIAQNAVGEHIANKNTFALKAPSAICNTFLNLQNIIRNPDITSLKNIYKGKTALICAAGPSLKENIETIKNNQDKFIIFALNPTLKLLSENQIKPDFIVNIETIDNIKQFEYINPQDHYFILESFCNNKIFQLKSKKTFNYISQYNFLNPYLRETLNITEELETMGTVSYTALLSANLMGFDEIIFCGQDLAYKNGQCYAQGSQFDDLECVFDEETKKYVIRPKDYENYKNRTVSEDIEKEEAIYYLNEYIASLNSNITTVKSQDGGFLPTQIGYSMFINWFVEASKKLKAQKPHIKLINSSTGGAQIDGFENISLEEAIKNHPIVERIDLTSYKTYENRERIKEKIKDLLDAVAFLAEAFSELILINNKIIKEIENKKIFTANAQKLLNKHKELMVKIIKSKETKELNSISNREIMRFEAFLAYDYFKEENLCKNTLKELNKQHEISQSFIKHCLFLTKTTFNQLCEE